MRVASFIWRRIRHASNVREWHLNIQIKIDLQIHLHFQYYLLVSDLLTFAQVCCLHMNSIAFASVMYILPSYFYLSLFAQVCCLPLDRAGSTCMGHNATTRSYLVMTTWTRELERELPIGVDFSSHWTRPLNLVGWQDHPPSTRRNCRLDEWVVAFIFDFRTFI